jgi:uncharacterized protein (DUF1778 family)
MTNLTPSKNYPLSIRLPETDIALIDRAANLKGRSRTEFMRDAAVREAEATLMDSMFIRMSPEGFDAFVAALDAPPKVVPELLEILKRKSPWDQK